MKCKKTQSWQAQVPNSQSVHGKNAKQLKPEDHPAGPEGTPYHGGCFMFDVFFPQDYPNVPPLMNMATNGEGRARFNPNLYADGKVSAPLINTINFNIVIFDT